MSKRFTDTDKWKKKFIRGLNAPYKLFWFYILDDCDHAGIWHVDIDVAKIRIGSTVDESVALEKFAGKILPFDNDEKWFIPDFIHFQYGELRENNRAHLSVINLLNKYELTKYLEGASMPLVSPLEGVKDKDKDKDKDKELDKDKEIETHAAEIIDPYLFEDFWNYYDKKTSDKRKCEKKYNKLNNKEKEQIFATLENYRRATPDKQYRKSPETYLNQRGWEHEIIDNGKQPTESLWERLANGQQG